MTIGRLRRFVSCAVVIVSTSCAGTVDPSDPFEGLSPETIRLFTDGQSLTFAANGILSAFPNVVFKIAILGSSENGASVSINRRTTEIGSESAATLGIVLSDPVITSSLSWITDPSVGAPGLITIVTFTDNRVRGTFEGFLVPFASAKTPKRVNGVFDVTLRPVPSAS